MLKGLFLNLFVALSFLVHGQLLNNQAILPAAASVAPPSAYTWTSGHIYTGSRDMWVYTPEGYPDNSDDYPLIVFAHGYGERGSNINDVLLAGAPLYINGGDRPPGVIICAPQDDSGDWVISDWDDVIDYMTTNYRINTNRVYITGLSGGAYFCRLVAQQRTSEVAAVVAAAGNSGGTWDWNAQADVGWYWVHGTTDGTATIPIQSFLNNANAVTRTTPFNTLTLWGIGHTATVWHTNVYNRKNRTNATGTAIFDYVDFLKKFSKDATERATLHVEYAEETQLIEDYRLAIQQVNRLSDGSTKTSLLSRLSTLKTTIDNGGKRYIIDFGATSSSHPNINTMTTATTSTTLSNIIDDDGGSSAIDLVINSQFATAPGSRMNNVGTRANGEYFGFELGVFSDGLRIEDGVTTGSMTLSSLPSGTYDIRIYHTFGSGNYSAESGLSVTINSVTKTQYSETVNTQYIEFTGLSPDGSNEITIAMEPVAGRNTQVCVLELYKHP